MIRSGWAGPVGEPGRLGLASLERYETDGDREALTVALAQLEQAVAATPDHPERMRWWYGLGSGYECRAEEDDSVEDYDRALHWYALLLDEMAATDSHRSAVVLADAGVHWSRYWLVRYGMESPDAGPRDPAALVDGLVAAVDRYPPGNGDPLAAAFVGMIRGLSYQERYELRHDPADRDRATQLLATCLPDLPDDTPWLAMATFELATAYREGHARDGDPQLLELAIAAGARAILLAREDQPTWLSAQEHQALCLTRRWRLTGDHRDLDRAIESCRVVLGRADDGWAAALGGELLRERGELVGDSTDVAEASRLLTRADPLLLADLRAPIRSSWGGTVRRGG